MSLHVLYVEDSPDDLLFMERAFQRVAPGVQLCTIANGQDAADYFDPAAQPEPPPEKLALAILDLNLPGRSGLEVLTQIRKKSRTPTLPVVIFSASNQQKDIDACYAAGGNAYLVKPSDSDGLRDLVSLIAENWLKNPVRPGAILPKP